jgi:hypothetical protein
MPGRPLEIWLECDFYCGGPLPDRPVRHESCRDIGVVCRESLGNRLVGGLEDKGRCRRAGRRTRRLGEARRCRRPRGLASSGRRGKGCGVRRTGPRRRRGAGGTRFLRESDRARPAEGSGSRPGCPCRGRPGPSGCRRRPSIQGPGPPRLGRLRSWRVPPQPAPPAPLATASESSIVSGAWVIVTVVMALIQHQRTRARTAMRSRYLTATRSWPPRGAYVPRPDPRTAQR